MESKTVPSKAITTALQDFQLSQTTQTTLSQSPYFTLIQKDHGVTSKMTDNYLHVIVILKFLPKEQHKPQIHNIQCIYRYVSLRCMCNLMPTSTCDDKNLLFK